MPNSPRGYFLLISLRNNEQVCEHNSVSSNHLINQNHRFALFALQTKSFRQQNKRTHWNVGQSTKCKLVSSLVLLFLKNVFMMNARKWFSFQEFPSELIISTAGGRIGSYNQMSIDIVLSSKIII